MSRLFSRLSTSRDEKKGQLVKLETSMVLEDVNARLIECPSKFKACLAKVSIVEFE